MTPEHSRIADSFIHVKIQYFGTIRVAAGKGEEEFLFASNKDVSELLQELANHYGKDFHAEIFEGSNLRADLMVTVNQAITPHETLAGLPIKQGDVVALFPIFPGGG